jgi:hypothetical protein
LLPNLFAVEITDETGLFDALGAFEAWGAFDTFGILFALFCDVFGEDFWTNCWGDDDFFADDTFGWTFWLFWVEAFDFFDEEALGLLDEAEALFEVVEGLFELVEDFFEVTEGLLLLEVDDLLFEQLYLYLMMLLHF